MYKEHDIIHDGKISFYSLNHEFRKRLRASTVILFMLATEFVLNLGTSKTGISTIAGKYIP